MLVTARAVHGVPARRIRAREVRRSKDSRHPCCRIPGSLPARMSAILRTLRRRNGVPSEGGRLTAAVQAHKMEALGRVASAVAHDFNNLLLVIQGRTEMILREMPPTCPCRGNIGEIEKAAERARILTRQLLAFSRRQPQELRVLDLNGVLAGMDRLLRRLIREDIQIVTEPAAGLWRVKADPAQVEQVILNLALNARDAMPSGGHLGFETTNILLDREAARRAAVASGSYVMLAVSDTGCGMTEEVRARLFEPFFTTKKRGGGTGLGLSTVYGIVRQGNGGLRVESEPGRGSRIEVFLPRVEEEIAMEPVHAVVVPLRGTETVLLVEDEESVRSVVAEFLRFDGYQVVESCDPGDALRTFSEYQGPIHLLVTDMVMRGESGLRLAERLVLLRPGLKVLLISGYIDEVEIRACEVVPGTAFLRKPFTHATLSHRVRELLDGSQPPDSD